MPLPPEVEAVLDEAYDDLTQHVQYMLAGGSDPRAIIGGMGRLFVQMIREVLSPEERADIATKVTEVLRGYRQ